MFFHIISPLTEGRKSIHNVPFPYVCLLDSSHTFYSKLFLYFVIGDDDYPFLASAFRAFLCCTIVKQVVGAIEISIKKGSDVRLTCFRVIPESFESREMKTTT
jgi:hypothetical protein